MGLEHKAEYLFSCKLYLISSEDLFNTSTKNSLSLTIFSIVLVFSLAACSQKSSTKEEKVLNKLVETYDITGLVGNGESYETLLEAGADSADIFIAATESDILRK